ncbi:hypothetical protein MUK42_12745 [Musa troglodytarum]|uniref:Uncharacterized protein n=1 Tax=Musa troglodytarum TaxID=320322 RepID=A0A9E7H844_9LILI|nr:hypothetical protein MUK42_12745 [Musa troglodytarum]
MVDRGQLSGYCFILSSPAATAGKPFKINAVYLRCSNKVYIILTSTKIRISGVDVEKFDDEHSTG